MLFWIILLLFYAVESYERSLPKDSLHSNIFLKASVGEMFELNSSFVRTNLTILPSWMCQNFLNKSLYQGIPLDRNNQIFPLHKDLSIKVNKRSKNIFLSQCRHRWPTILILFSDRHISLLSACKRTKLWRKALQFLSESLLFVENTKELKRYLSVLTKGPPNFDKPTNSALVYFIGCGSVKDSIISRLKSLEEEDYLQKLSEEFQYPIISWMIADIRESILNRKRRENSIISDEQYSLSRSSIFYFYEKRQRQEWSEGRIVMEGSGMYDQPPENVSVELRTARPIIPSLPTVVEKPKVIQSNTIPIVKRGLKNVTVFIGAKSFYQISPDTYLDKEDGFGNKMTLKVFIRSPDMETDFQVAEDSKSWIYYIPKQQVIVLQPRKNDGGVYNLVVCAYDSDKNRVCDGTTVTIRKPQSILKEMYLNAQPGVVWKYKLPEMWAETINSSEKDTLDIAVESSSLYEWMANTSTISLITEASISREHQLKLIAESMETGRKLIWSFVVTSVGHNAYVSATSVQIIIRLRISKLEKVPFSIINTLKEKLISTIARYNHNIYSTPRDILIYKIIDGRSAFMSNLSEKSLTISFIYVPKISFQNPSEKVTCPEVVISQDLRLQIQASLTELQASWIIEYVKLQSVLGRCQQDLRDYEERNTLLTTANVFPIPNQDKEISSWLNKTIKLTVRNGFIFKKIIIFPFQPEYKLIHKMELFDENNLVTDDSSWVSLSSSDYALFGLPLLENVRTEPYNFRLDVILKSGATQLVSVTISVERFTPRFDHKFEMILSIAEGDAMAHRGSFTTDQLPISHTLSYRWLLIQTLGSFLQSGQCLSHCGLNIFTHSLYEQITWLVNFSWSVLLNTAESSDPSTESQSSCDFTNLKSLISSLFVSEPNTDSMLAMFPSISNMSAKPSDSLTKSFVSRHLGTPTTVSTQISSFCFSKKNPLLQSSSSHYMSNITVFQGVIFAIKLFFPKDANKKLSISQIFFENNTLCDLSWLRLNNDGNVLYGLPLYSDLTETSVFLLRIYMKLEDEVEKNVSLRITVLPNSHIEGKSHMVVMHLKLTKVNPMKDLDLRVKTVRLLNQYLHPSCTLITSHTSSENFRFLDKNTENMKVMMSCEKAEDIILRHFNISLKNGQAKVSVEWSQMSFRANLSHCNIGSIGKINQELFQKPSFKEVSQELKSFFTNSGFGTILNAHLCLYGECSKVKRTSNICIRKDLKANMSVSTSSSNTKIVLLVLFLIIVVVACVCLGVYFLRRGLNDGEHSQEPRPVDKSPLPGVSKKPKKLIMQESSGINLTNNSPTTPLLSATFREDSKPDRHMESMFNNEDSTGSYSFAAARAKSPEPDICSSSEAGVPMCAVKQPSTSNVIRNPAMMMGSRLNPYRNIPPSIK